LKYEKKKKGSIPDSCHTKPNQRLNVVEQSSGMGCTGCYEKHQENVFMKKAK